MTKRTNYLFAILAAAYFMFAGTGYNVVKFCHKGCKMMATQVAAEPSCHKAQPTAETEGCCKKKQSAKKDNCCKKMHLIKNLEEIFLTFYKNKDGCFFVRASVDIPLEVTAYNFNSNEVKCIDLIYNTLQDQLRNQDVVYDQIYPPPELGFFTSGREILTQKSVLII